MQTGVFRQKSNAMSKRARMKRDVLMLCRFVSKAHKTQLGAGIARILRIENTTWTRRPLFPIRFYRARFLFFDSAGVRLLFSVRFRMLEFGDKHAVIQIL